MTSIISQTKLFLVGQLRAAGTRWAASIIAGLLGGIVVLLASAKDFDSIWLVLFVILPLGMSAIAAADFARLRDPRVAEVLFSAPVQPRDLVLAKLASNVIVVLAAWAVATTVASTAAIHIGWEGNLAAYVSIGFVLCIIAVGLGSLAGALVGFRSSAAAVALALGIGLFFLLAIPFEFLALSNANSFLAFFARLSPAVVLLQAGNVLEGYRFAQPWRAWIASLLLAIALFGTVVWISTRLQKPLGWNASSVQKIALVALLSGLFVVPAVAAGTDAARAPNDSNVYAYSNDGIFVALSPPGRSTEEARFDSYRGPGRIQLPVQSGKVVDVIVLFPNTQSADVSDIRVSLQSEDGKLTFSRAIQEFDTVSGLSVAAAGSRPGGQVLRFPVTLTARDSEQLGGEYRTLSVEAVYMANGRQITGSAIRSIETIVPNAGLQLAAPLIVAGIAAGAFAFGRRTKIAREAPA